MDARGRGRIASDVPLIESSHDLEEETENDEFPTRGHVDVVGNEVQVTEAAERSNDLGTDETDETWNSGIVFSAKPKEPETEKPSRFHAQPVAIETLVGTQRPRGLHASAFELRMPRAQDFTLLDDITKTSRVPNGSTQDVRKPPGGIARMCSISNHELRMPEDVPTHTSRKLNSATPTLPVSIPEAGIGSCNNSPKVLSFADPSTYTTINYTDDFDNHKTARLGDSSPRSPGPSPQSPRFSRQDSDLSDSSSYYDTVSSTSSTAALLKRAAGGGGPGGARLDSRGVPYQLTEEVDEFTVEYPLHPRAEYPRIFVEKVESVHPELEDEGLVQSSGIGGQALLAQSLDNLRKSFEDLSPVFSSKQDLSKTRPEEAEVRRLSVVYLRNLVVLSVGSMLCFTAFHSLRNLQSSINHEGGLGLMGMSTMYASFMIGCIFAPSIVNRARPKLALILAFHGLLVFVLANFYPKYYTIIPASAVLGFSWAILWTAQGTYLTSLGLTYAALTNKNHDAILGVFNGFFQFLLQIAMIVGNLMSSFVFNMELATEHSDLQELQTLENRSAKVDSDAIVYYVVPGTNQTASATKPDLLSSSSITGSANETNLTGTGNKELIVLTSARNLCGAAYCHSYTIDHASDGAQIQPYMLYILLGVFAAFTLAGILVLACFLNRLDVIFRRSQVHIAKQLLAIFSLHRDRKLWGLIPMLIYLGIEQSFIFGEVTKAFIACPLGVHMIGYVMVCFGACGAVAAFLVGTLQKCVPRAVIVCAGAALNLGILLVMLFWKPTAAQPYIVFMLAGAWGVCDGVWQTQPCTLCGLLFPHHREPAFASLRMYESIGFTLSMAYAQFLCMGVKIYMTGAMLILTVIGYFLLQRESEREKRESPKKQQVFL